MTGLDQSGLGLDIVALQNTANSGVPRIITKLADQSLTSVAVKTNDDTLFMPVKANERWRIDVVLMIFAASNAINIGIDFTGPAGATMAWGMRDTPVSNGNTWGATGIGSNPNALRPISSNVGMATGTWNVANTPGGMTLMGCYLGSTTAGTLQMRWQQGTSTATPLTLLAGSHMMAWRIA